MKQNALLWTLKQIKNRIPTILLLVLAQMGHAIFSVLFALGSRDVIDCAVMADSPAFTAACIRQAVVIFVILVCLTLSRHLRERLDADLERDWKQRLLKGLLQGEYAQVSAYHSAELVNRLNNDVAKVDNGILTILPSGAGMLTRLVAAVAVLGMLDLRFTLVAAALGCLVIAATALIRQKLKELNKEVSLMDGKVSGLIQELMEKLLLVQAMDLSNEVEKRSDVLLADRHRLQRRRKNISVLAQICISLLHYGGGFLALCWCAAGLLQGRMTFGALTAVIQLVNQLRSPFVNLSGVLPAYAAMTASAERLQELDTIQGQPQTNALETETLYGRMRSLEGSGLTFSYGRDIILDDADFQLQRGSFAVIVGPSGTGKSTLLKLLLGIFKPEQGRLSLRTDTEEIPLSRSTRRLFSYVPQGNLLFSGTIRDNLLIACPEASETQLEEAIHISCMDTFLHTLPLGLDTPLGENGAGLSEGQGQRLAIARAILGGAPVLLLDECTSALDEETEVLLLQRLKAMPDKTIIAVTHRPAPLKLCSCQWILENGKIRMESPK